ncbi:cupin domain-containing protein [Marinobacterium sp. AK62]|uniref:Cupin domain-containing protein n=1 Tax=Marinobacterium alkalitolerans TaxID=1542925 RepID=A0ABS3ZC79_9GAMM|nr:ChrR family anti-sigma-E factor [Marinobacterium alkalitolerans]MBP0048883.1 cupin domain-containing protein [Marinobacterium alkalitolerans]
MNISHHFDDATLMAYSAGTLPEGMALLVACHLHWCPHCRDRVEVTNSVGGALLDRLEPAALDDNALDSLLARLDEPEQEFASPEHSRSEPAGDSELPAPLAQLLGAPMDELPWKRIGYGVRQIDLELKGPGAARLLRISPGVSVPHHTHGGNELTLILKGSYNDELGRFCRGDVADLDGDVEHQPLVDTDEDCICLIATDAPLKFSGLMGRLVQPFIGL